MTGSLIAAAASAALMLLLASWLLYRSGDPLAPPITLTGDALQLVHGEGGSAADGIEIRQSGTNGVAIVQGAIRPLDAGRYRHLSWQVDGLKPDQKVGVIWSLASNSRAIREQTLSFDQDGAGRLDLLTIPKWEGQVVAIGLVVKGAIPAPLLVRRLELQPNPPTFAAVLSALAAGWTQAEGWTGRSINFDYGGPRDTRFRPVVVTAVWAALAGLLYFLLNPPWRGHRSLVPYAVILVMSWLALDLRWQWVLGQRLVQTQAFYAGLDDEARQLAGPDRHLYPFVREVRQRLPVKPARIFILSEDPNGYVSGRARYHLLPHHAYTGLSALPDAKQAHPGDYVLVLEPLLGLDYDRERHLLNLKAVQWLADLVYAEPGRGALFLLRRGF